MKRTLIIECGAAATRAALTEGEEVVRFWFGPARGDEADDNEPRTGRRFAGRVKSINKGLAAAFVDIGDGRDAYLALNNKNEALVIDGALIGVAVKSPPRQGKGAALKFLEDQTLDCETPGRLGPVEDAAIEAARSIGEGADEIVVDDGAAVSALKAAAVTLAIRHETSPAALFETYGAESALDEAFERVVALPGGGRVVIDEAQALTAIDVDTGGLSAASPQRLREKIAFAAADETARQIRLRNIGGQIVIDFPTISGDAARKRFNEQLRKAMARIEGAGAFGFSKSGLYAFTAPHNAQSLLERFTEPAPFAPVSGRRFTLDWAAKSAMRALEHRLRAHPQIRLRLETGSSLYAYINAHGLWTQRLNERYGARFDWIADEALEERGFELAEQ